MSLRTTVVGSWWPLPEHEQDLDRYHAGQLSTEEAKAVLNRATTPRSPSSGRLGWMNGPAENISLAISFFTSTRC